MSSSSRNHQKKSNSDLNGRPNDSSYESRSRSRVVSGNGKNVSTSGIHPSTSSSNSSGVGTGRSYTTAASNPTTTVPSQLRNSVSRGASHNRPWIEITDDTRVDRSDNNNTGTHGFDEANNAEAGAPYNNASKQYDHAVDPNVSHDHRSFSGRHRTNYNVDDGIINAEDYSDNDYVHNRNFQSTVKYDKGMSLPRNASVDPQLLSSLSSPSPSSLNSNRVSNFSDKSSTSASTDEASSSYERYLAHRRKQELEAEHSQRQSASSTYDQLGIDTNQMPLMSHDAKPSGTRSIGTSSSTISGGTGVSSAVTTHSQRPSSAVAPSSKVGLTSKQKQARNADPQKTFSSSSNISSSSEPQRISSRSSATKTNDTDSSEGALRMRLAAVTSGVEMGLERSSETFKSAGSTANSQRDEDISVPKYKSPRSLVPRTNSNKGTRKQRTTGESTTTSKRSSNNDETLSSTSSLNPVSSEVNSSTTIASPAPRRSNNGGNNRYALEISAENTKVDAARDMRSKRLSARHSSGSKSTLEMSSSSTLPPINNNSKSSTDPPTAVARLLKSHNADVEKYLGSKRFSATIDDQAAVGNNVADSNKDKVIEKSNDWSTYAHRKTKADKNDMNNSSVANLFLNQSPSGGDNSLLPASSEVPGQIRPSTRQVDEYLASRFTSGNLKSTTSQGISSMTKNNTSEVGNLSQSLSIKRVSPARSSSSSSEDDYYESRTPVIDLTDVSSNCEDEEVDDQNWSVRVCVVSAINFPCSLVPSIPFSPILKIGLVPVPNARSDQGAVTDSEADKEKEVEAIVQRNGLSSIRKSRLRCTSAKILSRRDNGVVEFHEEMRWDHVRSPRQTALAVELYSRSVMTPANIKESPCLPTLSSPTALANNTIASSPIASIPANSNTNTSLPMSSIDAPSSAAAGLSMLFRRPGIIRKSDSVEMEEANAAAAVAKHLIEGGINRGKHTSERNRMDSIGPPISKNATKSLLGPSANSEIDVTLRSRRLRNSALGIKSKIKKARMTDELRLGSSFIPLSKLSLDKVLADGKERCRIEQWFELKPFLSETSDAKGSKQSIPDGRFPAVLLEITFASSTQLNDSEDELDEEVDERGIKVEELTASFSKRASLQTKKKLMNETMRPNEVSEKESIEPVLNPGIIDYACVVGAAGIGDQKNDEGGKGWVNSTSECCILEQFPPNDEYHRKNGRSSVLPEKIEWFCFPEGCKLWRGLTPPNYDELNLKRFSSSSPSQISASFASFDACLGCTTSFSWFVMASNSDKYGSETTKTYGAVIRFYVPAPTGIDPTQDDFAQSGKMTSQATTASKSFLGSRIGEEQKRLWVPIGICLTSPLPIIGAMEVMLLRLCEGFASTLIPPGQTSSQLKAIHEHLYCLVMCCQKPVRDVVNVSIAFMNGDRLQINLPARNGLPPLPHGNAVSSACRVLGADGFNYILSALLTESKILIHSDDIANLCLIAEVMTSLMYPFQWALPYIPVLPVGMMEILEAPLSFILGIPTCNLNLVSPIVLEDIVVIDLDRDFSTSEYHDDKKTGMTTKTPTPLPINVVNNITKAVYRLMKIEGDLQEVAPSPMYSGTRSFPRLDQEKKAEREFRVAIALEVCSLIRGYEECVVFSSSHPVFNVDKFLKLAPAMFEEQRGTTGTQGQTFTRPVLSPRSRRFLSILVGCQHFHQFLESLQTESIGFFHILMNSLNTKATLMQHTLEGRLLSIESDRTMDTLCSFLQKLDERIPTFQVQAYASSFLEDELVDMPVGAVECLFPRDLLCQIKSRTKQLSIDRANAEGVQKVSLELLVELEKNPWTYQRLFDMNVEKNWTTNIKSVALSEALGERRYRSWKLNGGRDKLEADDYSLFSEESKGHASMALDFTLLLPSPCDEPTEVLNATISTDKKMADAKDRDTIRRCLEQQNTTKNFEASGTVSIRNLISEAKLALQRPHAREFLLSVLRKRSMNDMIASSDTTPKRFHRRSGASRLDLKSFDILFNLEWAMLDASTKVSDFNQAYSLLRFSAGLFTSDDENDQDVQSMKFLTACISLHPIFANLSLWERVKDMHLNARIENTSSDRAEFQNQSRSDELYEATVATLYEMLGYGVPAIDLSRFAAMVGRDMDWFRSERGQSLLLLTRRLCSRREQGQTAASLARTVQSELLLQFPSHAMVQKQEHQTSINKGAESAGEMQCDDSMWEWIDTGWCHPAATSSRRPSMADSLPNPHVLGVNTKPENEQYMKRSAVTSMIYLGSSIVASGGLDGGVFIARAVKLNTSDDVETHGVRGFHLDWGSSGSRHAAGSPATSSDGEYGVGAITCLAATRGLSPLASSSVKANKDTSEPYDDEEVVKAMEGCRVVAGTTCGDLRVWAIKDVFSAVFYNSSESDILAHYSINYGAESSTASLNSRHKGSTDFAAGSSLTRLKFSLRGRALSGHRGGVSCIEVTSDAYRPDSIASGGADGLIKLWNLRPSGTLSMTARTGSLSSVARVDDSRSKDTRTGDALSIMSGHGGRVLCLKAAWHGDRLLSGGADRTVRLWDVSGGGGKCINSLSGHLGWVTHVKYWGENTIISASTDRSVALWDQRIRTTPLFVLRHHYAPVSDILVGDRTDPLAISAGTDGTVVAWDFRRLPRNDDTSSSNVGSVNEKKQIVRKAVSSLFLHDFNNTSHVYGRVCLTRSYNSEKSTVLIVGSDAIVREWNAADGKVLSEAPTGHCDTISTFLSLQEPDGLGDCGDGVFSGGKTGSMTSSWDGTIRMRYKQRIGARA